MSIFDAHYLFFFSLLFLTSIIRSVAMHAFVREEGRHFICAWNQIIVLEEEEEEEKGVFT